ncbi:hypothetical protein ACFY2W_02795 [Streptomyces sp. NPDC001262]
MRLTAEEREAFLGEVHVASFAVDPGERGRGPVAVPSGTPTVRAVTCW